MRLTAALANDTDTRTRSRGAEYFSRGAVHRLTFTAGTVAASVQGTELYAVNLRADRHAVYGSCTCAYFQDRLEPCKHIWAVALACEARQLPLLPADVGADDVIFEPIHGALAGTGGERTVGPYQPRPQFRIPPAPVKPWRQALANIQAETDRRLAPAWRPPAPARLLYVVDLALSQQNRAITLHVMTQERKKKTGDWGVPRASRMTTAMVRALPPEDRALVERMTGGQVTAAWGWSPYEIPATRVISDWLALELFPHICGTGRCYLAATQYAGMMASQAPLTPLRWDAGEPWAASIRVRRDEAAKVFHVEGEMQREGETMPFSNIVLIADEELMLTWTTIARCRHDAAMAWARQLRMQGSLAIPLKQAPLLRTLLLDSSDANIVVPAELRTDIRQEAPVPRLAWSRPAGGQAEGAVTFAYGDAVVAAADGRVLIETADPAVMLERDRASEERALARLCELGARPLAYRGSGVYSLAPKSVMSVSATLLGEGWHVEDQGQVFRLATDTPKLRISSGIDWFDVDGLMEFGSQQVALPALLKAVERGDAGVQLADGSIGMIPPEWRRQYGSLALGHAGGNVVRFSRTQAALLDALLADRPAVSWDDTFERARQRLRGGDTIAPLAPPATFTGELRGYQREGLGWLVHLQALGFGGCLADDMGLGKTVMVLAMLDARRTASQDQAGRRPSLVVAPRSVIFNWKQEAERFTPALRVLDYTTAARRTADSLIQQNDLVLTTYGTLRRDAPHLAVHRFDCLILDEAQTIKNPATVTAKAVRTLQGDHRLALSGTPVENRLTDLWSIFEFLNPGLLSNVPRFTRTLEHDADGEQLRLIGRGLRPFILRRTKEQVAKELPPKVEQTLMCELDRRQRTLYDELRDHYRRELLNPRSRWEKKRLQVLEALLRLRQAACHPGLVNRDYGDHGSAKFELLLPRLLELADEGHKALVFSQFTSFLALLRDELDARGLVHEYLDGKTRDRSAPVTRFQTDPACRLFLVSLKAGGVGLNLTAADYVFLLDPWWNPAVEAQAIDRSHRIGQSRHVFAYRIIARDTVEERVLELQQRKRTLADAILTEDNSVLKNLTRDDLEALLS